MWRSRATRGSGRGSVSRPAAASGAEKTSVARYGRRAAPGRIRMKRSWHAPIWIGVVVLVVGLFSYPFLFRFPATRDFPWVSVASILLGGSLIAIGLARAFRDPQRYRGRIGGTIAAMLAIGLTGFFLYATFVGARKVPASKGAPQV